MANRKELRENALTQYRRDFDLWLYDFKKTDTYTNIVIDYERCWSKIYKELNRIFRDTVWNQMKLKNETSTKEDDPRLKIDASQLNNYRRQFDVWVRKFKKTSDYLGLVAGYRECWSKIYTELHRIFKLNIWDPEKTVDINYVIKNM